MYQNSHHDLVIELATISDTEVLAGFINAAYRGDSSRQGWTTEADILGGQRIDESMLREQLSQSENTILLFKKRTQLVACVFLQRRGDTAYLGMFTVAPALQGSGIGKFALSQIEVWVCAKWGTSRVEMLVITRRQELVAWYMRRGYIDSGRREPFPYGDEKFGLPKVDDLEMMHLEKKLSAPPQVDQGITYEYPDLAKRWPIISKVSNARPLVCVTAREKPRPSSK